jgi:deoxyadenosine/deoxycytidine kinase
MALAAHIAYEDQDRWALPMQLSFLVARHHQLSRLVNAAGCIVADHTYAKDRMFATMLLKSARELALYEQVHGELTSLVRTPDLVVYLDATTPTLLSRIAARGRAYESSITAEYLDQLRASYDDCFSAYPGGSILYIRTDNLDLSSSLEMEDLFRAVEDAAVVATAGKVTIPSGDSVPLRR